MDRNAEILTKWLNSQEGISGSFNKSFQGSSDSHTAYKMDFLIDPKKASYDIFAYEADDILEIFSQNFKDMFKNKWEVKHELCTIKFSEDLDKFSTIEIKIPTGFKLSVGQDTLIRDIKDNKNKYEDWMKSNTNSLSR